MTTAILLIAHGSRRPEANADLQQAAALLRPSVQPVLVETAYLELAEPSIPAGLQRCIDQGATSIRLLPYFLSAGSHVTRDLERFRREFAAAHPACDCRLCPPLGLHAGVIAALVDRSREELPPPADEA
jgi:sirohydrochlorin ferrochelatase